MRNTSTLILLVIGMSLTLYPTSPVLYVGLAILTLVAMVNLLRKDPITRTKWIFGTIFFLMASLITVYAWRKTGVLPSDTLLERMPYRLWSLSVGFGLSFIATFVMFATTIYISGIYVLGLKDIEGLTGWHAFKSIVSLIFNTQYDWIVISDGKIVKTHPKGVLKELGGPGKVIINTGNAVIFERAGTITQIRGAGAVKTHLVENIRTIIDLRKQYHQESFETFTADKFTVEVTVSVVYQILPAEREPEPRGKRIVKQYDYKLSAEELSRIPADENRTALTGADLYPVYEGTLLKAAFGGTAGGWQGFAAGATVNVVRDQIMATTLDHLFMADKNETDPEVKANSRTTKEIEQVAFKTVNKFAANNGVEILAVDIRSIKLPKSVEDTLAKIKRLEADTDAIRRLEQARNTTKKELLETIVEMLHSKDEKHALAPDDVRSAIKLLNALDKQRPEKFMEQERTAFLKSLAKSDGTKIISTGGNNPIETPISVD